LNSLRQQLGDPQLELRPLPAGGNSQVRQILSSHNGELVVKKYLADGRQRLETEYAAISFLFAHGLPVPRPCCVVAQYDYAVYQKLAGHRVDADEISSSLINQLLDFLRKLHALRAEAKGFPPAAEACLVPADVIAIIERRRGRFTSVDNPALQRFLHDCFDPLCEALCGQYRQRCGVDFQCRLPTFEKTLSPSDFGFHNTLLGEDGTLGFVDFEYFGWDDPAKLIADFLWHPAMELPVVLKRQFVSGCLNIYGPACRERWQESHLLHGLKWVLLLLNEFIAEDWQRRQFAGEQRQRDDRLQQQLAKAKRLLQRIEEEREGSPYGD